MYFLMMPLSLSGGSQETNTTELLEAAALTPAGGPGTGGRSEQHQVQRSQDKRTEIMLACVVLVHIALCMNQLDVLSPLIISRPNIPIYTPEKVRRVISVPSLQSPM